MSHQENAAHELFAIDVRIRDLIELDLLDTDEGERLVRRRAEIEAQYGALVS